MLDRYRLGLTLSIIPDKMPARPERVRRRDLAASVAKFRF